MNFLNVVYVHNEILFSHKEERNSVIYGKTNGTGWHCVKQCKLGREIQLSHAFLFGSLQEEEGEGGEKNEVLRNSGTIDITM